MLGALLEGAAGRQLVRPLSRRRHPGVGPRRAGPSPARKIRLMATARLASGRAGRRGLHPKGVAALELGPGEIELHHRPDHDPPPIAGSATRSTDDRRPAGRGAARLQAGAAGGVLRLLPDRSPPITSGCSDSLAKLAPQRRQFRSQSGNLCVGVGLRLSLWLSRPPASRIRPGAPHPCWFDLRPHHHQPLGGFYRVYQTNGRALDLGTTRRTCPIRCGSTSERQPWIWAARSCVPDDYLGQVHALCQETPRAAAQPDLCRQPRDGGLSPPVERGRVRLRDHLQICWPRRSLVRLIDHLDGHDARATCS